MSESEGFGRLLVQAAQISVRAATSAMFLTEELQHYAFKRSGSAEPESAPVVSVNGDILFGQVTGPDLGRAIGYADIHTDIDCFVLHVG